MKKTKEELRKNRFLKLVTLLLDRFYMGKDIDLNQLDEMVRTGEINQTLNQVPGTWFEKIKEFEFSDQKLLLLRVCLNMNLKDLVDRINIENFNDVKFKNNNQIFKFLSDQIVSDQKVYFRRLLSIKSKYPSLYVSVERGFISYRQIDNAYHNRKVRWNNPQSVLAGSLLVVAQ